MPCDTPEDVDPIFGPVIHRYTRAQAIEDGVLVDVSGLLPTLVAEARIRFPVAMTTAVWTQYVEFPPEVVGQDLTGRLWAILWVLRCAARQGGRELLIQLHVRDDNRGPKLVTLKAVCGPGDTGEPVITIMLPEED